LKGILGIYRYLFIGTITSSSSNPQKGELRYMPLPKDFWDVKLKLALGFVFSEKNLVALPFYVLISGY